MFAALFLSSAGKEKMNNTIRDVFSECLTIDTF